MIIIKAILAYFVSKRKNTPFVWSHAQLPSSQPSPDSPDYTSTLKTLHILLLEVHVLEGTLIDKENGRAFKIDNGIPNMILLEDEIER